MEGTGPADAASRARVPGPARGVQELPLDLLLGVLRRVSKAQGLGGPLHFALVCRRFAALRFRAAALRLRACVPGPRLADELRVYQGPTSLELSDYSVRGLRALWRALAVQGPALTALSVLCQADTCVDCEGECPDSHRRRDSQLCARSGQASAWWAFSGPFLRAQPRLRSLVIQGYHSGRATCSRCCVCFRGPGSFVSAPELRSSLPRLTSLTLHEVNLGWPQDWPSALPALKSLGVFHAKGTHDAACVFPWAVLGMSGLTSLALDLDLHSVADRDFGRLAKLRRLSLTLVYPMAERDDLVAPASMWALTGLRSLTLFNIGHVPDSGLGRLTGLTELLLTGARLRSLPYSLQALKIVEVDDITGLEGLQDRFGRRANLRTLSLRQCDFSRSLPADFGELASLTDLCLNSLPSLEELTDGFGGLLSLGRLRVSECRRLERLSADFGQLGHLTELDLGNLQSLKELPDDFGRLQSLQGLTLLECGTLRRLPSDFGHLSSLTDLRLEHLDSLEELPTGFGSLLSLTFLEITSCQTMRRLPADFGQLASLTHLNLGHLQDFEELPETLMTLGQLRNLILDRLTGLRRSRVPGLVIDNMHGNTSLGDTSLPTGVLRGLGGLLCLEQLTVIDCGPLVALPEHLQRLSLLKSLKLIRATRPDELDEEFLRRIPFLNVKGHAGEPMPEDDMEYEAQWTF